MDAREKFVGSMVVFPTTTKAFIACQEAGIRRAFRQLFESLPQDVQHSLCSAPSNCQARLAFWLDKLPTIPDDVQRNEVEAVLRAAFARAAARQAATFWED